VHPPVGSALNSHITCNFQSFGLASLVIIMSSPASCGGFFRQSVEDGFGSAWVSWQLRVAVEGGLVRVLFAFCFDPFQL
jgi:hypothetical protein